MFQDSSSIIFLNIDSKKGFFKIGDEAKPAGIKFLGTVVSVELHHDEGNIKKKVQPRDEVKLKMESGADTYLLSIPLGLFLGLKFICQLPDCKTPHLTIVPREGEGENSDSPNIFLGYRESETATNTTYCKWELNFDKDKNIFEKEGKKEIKHYADILQQFCDFFTIPFTDKRPQA